jgi:FMN-dependent NADH-azoreductase
MSLNVLAIQSSGRADSVSSTLVQALVLRLQRDHADARVVQRDLKVRPLPQVDAAWIAGAFGAPADRTAEQVQALRLSDELIDELLAADVLVIGVPIYNFSVPAALKAWVDQVVRAGRTFAFDGPGQFRGLLPAGKKVYLAVASGGVPVGSEADLATAYLRLVLGFIGLTDVTVYAADQLQTLGPTQLDQAKARIEALAA